MANHTKNRNMAGSKAKEVPKVLMGPDHRAKIANSNILNKLIAFVDGPQNEDDEKVTLNQTQVHAALGLLKKVMPDLSAVDSTVEHTGSNDLAALMERIAQENNRIGPDYRPPEPVNGATPDGK